MNKQNWPIIFKTFSSNQPLDFIDVNSNFELINEFIQGTGSIGFIQSVDTPLFNVDENSNLSMPVLQTIVAEDSINYNFQLKSPKNSITFTDNTVDFPQKIASIFPVSSLTGGFQVHNKPIHDDDAVNKDYVDSHTSLGNWKAPVVDEIDDTDFLIKDVNGKQQLTLTSSDFIKSVGDTLNVDTDGKLTNKFISKTDDGIIIKSLEAGNSGYLKIDDHGGATLGSIGTSPIGLLIKVVDSDDTQDIMLGVDIPNAGNRTRVPGAPTEDYNIANKKYVDSRIGTNIVGYEWTEENIVDNWEIIENNVFRKNAYDDSVRFLYVEYTNLNITPQINAKGIIPFVQDSENSSTPSYQAGGQGAVGSGGTLAFNSPLKRLDILDAYGLPVQNPELQYIIRVAHYKPSGTPIPTLEDAGDVLRDTPAGGTEKFEIVDNKAIIHLRATSSSGDVGVFPITIVDGKISIDGFSKTTEDLNAIYDLTKYGDLIFQYGSTIIPLVIEKSGNVASVKPPTDDNHLTNKKYVDGKSGGVVKSVGDTLNVDTDGKLTNKFISKTDDGIIIKSLEAGNSGYLKIDDHGGATLGSIGTSPIGLLIKVVDSDDTQDIMLGVDIPNAGNRTRVPGAPTEDYNIANKKYVDDTSAAQLDTTYFVKGEDGVWTFNQTWKAKLASIGTPVPIKVDAKFFKGNGADATPLEISDDFAKNVPMDVEDPNA